MQSRLLSDEICRQVTDLFASELTYPVELVLFTCETLCDTCVQTHQLLEELTELSDLLYLTIYDIDKQAEAAQKYHIDFAPGLVIIGKDQEKSVDYGIRFLGIPSGYEFSSLIHSISLVSRRDSGLRPEIRNELQEIKTPIDLKIFVTPT